MKGKQKGLTVSDDGFKTEVKLYNTIVMTYDHDHGLLELSHGGWITKSTVKAINTGLNIAGIPAKARIKNFSMFFEAKGELMPITDKGSMIMVYRGDK